jgi:hypothetical protein
MGDCCAYALAKALNKPLLYKGNDFVLTDVEPALPYSITSTLVSRVISSFAASARK